MKCSIVILVVLCIAVAADCQLTQHRHSFVPSRNERRQIEDCLHGNPIAPTFAAQCDLLRDTTQRMRDKSSLNRDRRDSKNLEFEYIKKLVAMKNIFQHPEESLSDMLNTVAPCANFSPRVKQKWDRFFEQRGGQHRNEAVSLRPANQHVHGDNVTVAFNRPIKVSNFSLHQPIGVDLTLLRTPPCQLDEGFGMYEVTVRKIPNNVSEPEVIMHRSTQSTCASTEGYMMVLSLDLQISMDWFLRGDDPLQLSVHVRPIRQVLSGNNVRETTTARNVLRRVLSLTFQMRVGPQAKQQFPIRISQARAMRRMGWISRMKRSASRGIRGCEKVSYPLDFQQEWFRHRFTFPLLPDVGECVGRCDFPIHMPTNATNHAVVLNVERAFSRRRSGVQPTVDCVPTSYYSMFVSWQDDENFETGFLDDFAVKHCGCA